MRLHRLQLSRWSFPINQTSRLRGLLTGLPWEDTGRILPCERVRISRAKLSHSNPMVRIGPDQGYQPTQVKRTKLSVSYEPLSPELPGASKQITNSVNSISAKADTGTQSRYSRPHTGSIRRETTIHSIWRWLTKKQVISREPVNTS